jgi:hypothetical protein
MQQNIFSSDFYFPRLDTRDIREDSDSDSDLSKLFPSQQRDAPFRVQARGKGFTIFFIMPLRAGGVMRALKL